MRLITYVNVLQLNQHVVLEKPVILEIMPVNVELPAPVLAMLKVLIVILLIMLVSVRLLLHYVHHQKLVMVVPASAARLVLV